MEGYFRRDHKPRKWSKNALRQLAGKTNLSAALAEFNVHEYASRNVLAHAGLDEWIAAKQWGFLAAQIHADQLWLNQNNIAEEACDKVQVLASIKAFKDRKFIYTDCVPSQFDGEVRCGCYLLTPETLAKEAEFNAKLTRIHAEEMRQQDLTDAVVAARSIPVDHWYGPLRTAREELLDLGEEAENAKARSLMLSERFAEKRISTRRRRHKSSAKPKYMLRHRRTMEHSSRVILSHKRN